MKKIEGIFTLIDLSTTHNQLLYRSFGESMNVDLIFEGVSYFDILWSLTNPTFNPLTSKPESKVFLSDTISNSNEKFVAIDCEEGSFFISLKRILICENNYIGDSTSIPCKIDPDGEKRRVDEFMKAIEEGIENPELEVVEHNIWQVLVG